MNYAVPEPVEGPLKRIFIMLEDFLEQTEFKDYNDFFANYKIKVPANFNFGYDVVDVLAQRTPDATAFIWCNDNDEELRMTFGELKERTDKAAAYSAVLELNAGTLLCLSFNAAMNSGFLL